MLRFNILGGLNNVFSCFISIHLMLRFNKKQNQKRKKFEKFQYILCYGSTLSIHLKKRMQIHFNTSYVTVQHLLATGFKDNQLAFQYILCYGSTLIPCTNRAKTIYISIHLMLRFNLLNIYQQTGFNRISIHLMLRFNVFLTTRKTIGYIISIHLMLRFNAVQSAKSAHGRIFQYILCYGSTELFVEDTECVSGFQYILCYGST